MSINTELTFEQQLKKSLSDFDRLPDVFKNGYRFKANVVYEVFPEPTLQVGTSKIKPQISTILV
jgi:hypothetical protein